MYESLTMETVYVIQKYKFFRTKDENQRDISHEINLMENFPTGTIYTNTYLEFL